MSLGKNLLLVLCSVILLNLSLPPFDAGLLRYIALVPLLFFIAKSGNMSLVRRGIWLFLFAFLFLLWQYSGIFLSLPPLDWANITSPYTSWLIVSGIWIGLSFALALAAFPLLLAFSQRFFSLFPILFVLWEYLRSYFFSIIFLGPGSFIADIFPFGFLGTAAHTSGGLLFFAPFAGIYGFSFFVALINLIVFYLLFGKSPIRKKLRLGALAVLVASLGVAEWMPFPQSPPADSDKSLKIISINEKNPVQFRYTDEYYLDMLPRRLATVKEALSQHPDTQILIFSENSQFLRTLEMRASLTPEEITELLFSKEQDTPRLIIDGEHDNGKNASVARASMSTGEEFFIYKDILMPFGEYQPYILKAATKILGQESVYDALAGEKNTVGVQSGTKTIETPIGNIAIVACSEILTPAIYRKIRKESPDIIIQQQRLAHFRDTPKIFDQILALSQIRAATLRKFIVGSVDGPGFSYAISPYGELIAKSNAGDGYLFVKIPAY